MLCACACAHMCVFGNNCLLALACPTLCLLFVLSGYNYTPKVNYLDCKCQHRTTRTVTFA